MPSTGNTVAWIGLFDREATPRLHKAGPDPQPGGDGVLGHGETVARCRRGHRSCRGDTRRRLQHRGTSQRVADQHGRCGQIEAQEDLPELARDDRRRAADADAA